MNIKRLKINSETEFMITLILGCMMNPLNSTMLATALTQICNSFNENISSGAILISALYITSAIGQPLMGRLADIFNAKKINTLGFILVFIASLIGIFALNFNWLIVSRIILGLGTSAAYPSAMALINKRYKEKGETVPGKILGAVAISSQVSIVLGPLLGGILTQLLGWKGIFFINIPWVLSALYFSKVVPDFPANLPKNKKDIFQKVDGLGVIFFSLFLISIMFLLMQHVLSLTFILLAFFSITALIIWESKHDNPFIMVKILAQKPSLSLVYIRALLTNYILYLMIYALPQWIEGVKHISPANTGLLMMPMSIMSALVALFISKSDNPVKQNIIGVISLVISCLSLLILEFNTPIAIVFIATLLMGLSIGINMIANQSLLNVEAPEGKAGISFGLYRTFGYIGAIFLSSQMKSVFHNGISDKNFHNLVYSSITACILLIILIIPLIIRKNETKIQNSY